MNINELLTECKELMSKDKIEKTIETLKILSKQLDNVDVESQIIHLSNQYYNYKREYDMNLTKDKERRDKVVNSLLELITSISKTYSTYPSIDISATVVPALPKNDEGEGNIKKGLSIFFITILIILISGFVFYHFYTMKEEQPRNPQLIGKYGTFQKRVDSIINIAYNDTGKKNIKIIHFKKDINPKKDFSKFGYNYLDVKPINDIPINTLWYGNGISVEHIRLVSLILLENGIKIRGIQPINRFYEQRYIIQVASTVDNQAHNQWGIEDIITKKIEIVEPKNK